jgi:hypothetical protein
VAKHFLSYSQGHLADALSAFLAQSRGDDKEVDSVKNEQLTIKQLVRDL